MRPLLLVAVGGACGSVARWLLSGWVQRLNPVSGFPWGTIVVNGTGSLAIGLVLGLSLERALVPPNARLFLVTGVLGGFTTFSAFSWEALALLRNGQWPAAAGYVLGSLVVGVLGALAGWSAALRM